MAVAHPTSQLLPIWVGHIYLCLTKLLPKLNLRAVFRVRCARVRHTPCRVSLRTAAAGYPNCIAADSTVVLRRGPAPGIELGTLADVRLGDVIMVRITGKTPFKQTAVVGDVCFATFRAATVAPFGLGTYISGVAC